MKHITRIHCMEPMIQKSNLLTIDGHHIFLHTLYSIEPGLYSSPGTPLTDKIRYVVFYGFPN